MKEFSINPQVDFIIHCLHSELVSGYRVPNSDNNLDWEQVYNLLIENRLAPHFSVFSKLHIGIFPNDIQYRLKQARYANLLYGDQCKIEVQQVLRGLTEAGIPVIVMKGWALIQWLYNGDHGQRFCEDIDILIPPETYESVDQILQQLNYSGVTEAQPGYARRFTNAIAYSLAGEYTGPFRKFSIGLHWGLTHFPYFDEKRINIPELFVRARPLKVAGVDVLELSFEDQLIYTCAHLMLHHRNEETLLNYFEIAAIIQRAGVDLDWQVILDRSRDWHYLVQVQNVLKKVNDLWPELIPTDGYLQITEAESSLNDKLIDYLVAKNKGNPFRSAVVEMLALPGWRNKLSCAFQQIFPGKEYMVNRYALPEEHTLFWLYIIRLKKAISGFFKKNLHNFTSY
jgi:hypothetical protein